MNSDAATFAFVIATKNRCAAVVKTLESLRNFMANPAVTCVVYDDGSTDDTTHLIQAQFPKVEVWRNEFSKGYLYCRNQLLNRVEATYLISLDDDAHFLTHSVLEEIQTQFASHSQIGVLAFRIFWSEQTPQNLDTSDLPQQVKSYVGCGHAWRKSAWNAIPNYPEWYQFYGEENWASLQLFVQGFGVLYTPQILVHHRVDLEARAQNRSGFVYRYRCSLRADWFTYFMLYPWPNAIYYWLYSLAKQFQKIIFNSQINLLPPVLFALFDFVRRFPKLLQNRKPLRGQQFKQYQQVKEAKIYWNPEK